MKSITITSISKGALGLCVAVLISCSQQDDSSSSDGYGPDSPGLGGGMGFESYGAASGSGRNYVQRGTDQFFNPSAFADTGSGKAVVVPADGENVQLSLVNATISAAAKAVLGDSLKLNYVVADGLEGRVTLQTTAPIPKDTLLELFNAALAANGAQIVQDGNVVKVVGGTDGNTTFRLAGADGASSSAIMVAPLNFVSATEMVKILQPLIDQGLKVDVQRQRNLLLLSGEGGKCSPLSMPLTSLTSMSCRANLLPWSHCMLLIRMRSSLS